MGLSDNRQYLVCCFVYPKLLKMAEKYQNVGAIWSNFPEGKKPYMKMELGGKEYVIFANDFKKEDKHPDYLVYNSRPK